MIIIGHRGAKGLAPENTTRGLQKAMECHVDEIECDVRTTKDQIVILNHNPFITDNSGNKIVIADTSYHELIKHKSDITTLAQALATVNQTIPLIVEVKPKQSISPIIKIIRHHLQAGWQPSSLLLASFDQTLLLKLHKEFPDVPKIVNESWSGVRASYHARQLATKRINMNVRWLWSGFLAAMLRAGYQICPYTVNEPAKIRHWQKYIYGVITDYPDRFK